MKVKIYEYLCVDNKGNYFILIGNFKDKYNHKPKFIWEFKPTMNKGEVPYYWVKSHYGYRKNTSGANLPKEFRILNQQIYKE